LQCFIAVVVRLVKCPGICGEEVEAFGVVELFVVRRLSVGYCGDY